MYVKPALTAIAEPFVNFAKAAYGAVAEAATWCKSQAANLYTWVRSVATKCLVL